jgi:hypothetical protein
VKGIGNEGDDDGCGVEDFGWLACYRQLIVSGRESSLR